MHVERADIPDVLIIQPKKHGDHRGFFSETFRASALEEFGVELNWCQDNHSFSQARGVVRALHFQRPPFAQAKLLRVIRGAVLDVVVDIRKASPTYGRHVAVELSAENWKQILVPAGFAHGFCVVSDIADVTYKVSSGYDAATESGFHYADPDVGIRWPVDDPRISARDARAPRLAELAR